MTTPRPAAPPEVRTEAGKRLVQVRDLHTPDCPRWSDVSRPDARCTCILPEMVLAIEAEAAAEAAQREAVLQAAADFALETWDDLDDEYGLGDWHAFGDLRSALGYEPDENRSTRELRTALQETP